MKIINEAAEDYLSSITYNMLVLYRLF